MTWTNTVLATILVSSAATQTVCFGQGSKKGDDKNQVPDGIKALYHENPQVRYRAVAVLGRLGKVSQFAVPHLVKVMLKDKEMSVRVKAAESVWKIDKNQADVVVSVLRKALRDKKIDVRIAATRVAAQMGEAAKPLVSTLATNLRAKELNLRMTTVSAIEKLGPAASAAAGPLLEMHKAKDFFLLEPMVSVALGNLGKSAVYRLRTVLKSSDQLVLRRMAAYALGLIGPDAMAAKDDLATALQKDKADVRALAAKALGRIGPAAKSTTSVLEKSLKDKDAKVQIYSALALYQVGKSKKGFPILTQMTKHKSPFVRQNACRAIAAMGKEAKPFRDTLIAVFKDESPSVRITAIQSLEKITPGDEGLAALIGLFNDESELVRVEAAYTIAKSGAPKAVRVALPFLKDGLSAKSSEVRLRTVRALGNLGADAKPLFTKLAVLTEDANASVRRAAVAALKKIDAKAAAALGIR